MDWCNYSWNYSWINVWFGVLMNANELADELSKQIGGVGNIQQQAATMLRQQQAEIEVNKYGYELNLNIKIEELKEKDVCLKLLHDRITHLNKMVVYYQDIFMSGTHSEEYEEGFWDAVDFVRKAQEHG